MSVKDFIKAHCPESVLPFLQTLSHIVHWPVHRIRSRIVSIKALKYLPYYQDSLSREILFDCLEYLRTKDKNIFLDRAEKIGMKFYDFFYDVPGCQHSGIVLLYDKEDSDFRYSQRLLSSSIWTEKYRLMTLQDFINEAKISDTELIAPLLTLIGRRKFDAIAAAQNLKADVYGRILLANREDLQYFDVFSPLDDEVVIDDGAFDGATAIQFIEWGKGRVKKVYSFEFDPANIAKCEENLRPYADKVTIINKGTWDKDEVMHINASGRTGSTVNSTGSTAVSLTTIDKVMKDERVTFIKMDIEGAELKSLMGARNTIIKNHPRLAICVYHKASDLYEIPGYILSLVPGYKFFLRHYSSLANETVIYAYCD